MNSTNSFSRFFTQIFWIFLPLVFMTQFEKCIMLVLKYGFGDNINPVIFFYLPFLSIVPPLLLFFVVFWQKGILNKWVLATKATMFKDLITGLITGIVAVCIFYVSVVFLREMEFQVPDFSSFTITHHIFFSTLGALVPGVAEELYFRGFLSQKLNNYHYTLGILISAISFSLWHILSPAYLLHTFLLGLLFGFVYHGTGRLLPVVVAHTLANMTVGILIMAGLF